MFDQEIAMAKMLTMGNKGQLGGLTSLAYAIVIFTIVVVAGALILAKFAANTSVTSDTTANQTVVNAQTAVRDLSGWLGIIVVIVVAAVILGLFGLRGMQAGSE
jgi:lysylphosphatidylglycerol synthetase-like protein (DUF2156 family)